LRDICEIQNNSFSFHKQAVNDGKCYFQPIQDMILLDENNDDMSLMYNAYNNVTFGP
jgi:hypothetical protein